MHVTYEIHSIYCTCAMEKQETGYYL